jgi:hypothetical protein
MPDPYDASAIPIRIDPLAVHQLQQALMFLENTWSILLGRPSPMVIAEVRQEVKRLLYDNDPLLESRQQAIAEARFGPTRYLTVPIWWDKSEWVNVLPHEASEPYDA